MSAISGHVERVWADDITPALQRYIAIPNVSVSYDADWEAHGYMDEAVQLVREWCAARPIKGITVDVHRIPGRTPLILVEVPASDPARSRPNGAAVRTPRQAAGDDRMA